MRLGIKGQVKLDENETKEMLKVKFRSKEVLNISSKHETCVASGLSLIIFCQQRLVEVWKAVLSIITSSLTLTNYE